MANRLYGNGISKTSPMVQSKVTPTTQIPTATKLKSSGEPDARLVTAARPLSDIRELTEPSLLDLTAFKNGAHLLQRKCNHFRDDGAVPDRSSTCKTSTKALNVTTHISCATPTPPQHATSSSYSSTPEHPNLYTIPHSSVPRRSSSQHKTRAPSGELNRKPSNHARPQTAAAGLEERCIPNRGYSHSPVKEPGLRLDPITADSARRAPLRTYHRDPLPYDVLEYPEYKHPRVKLYIEVSAPMFVGGGSVEGFVRVTVDDKERTKQRRSLGIRAISIELVGFEEVADSRKAIFLALGSELIDATHPPPATMTEPANPIAIYDGFWTLTPSTSTLPFLLSLPLDTGPPPFRSRHASIRFTLCATALILDASKHYRIRTSQEVFVLPTYDPEQALTSLPSPLTASDELQLPRPGGCETVRVTAGLHRQVWVSGSSIFVDVHTLNRSRKLVKRLDLSLECNVLCYKHAAATMRVKSAVQARIFESNHRTLLAMTSLRANSNGWSGVEPHTSQTRTCDLELPKGHATIRCGKYFEVRYFLNVAASISNTKLVSVQLPIILVHMNSLDVVPNSVAQVAAAVEEKRQLARNQSRRHRRRHTSEIRTGPSMMPARQRSVSSPTARATGRSLHRQPSYSQGRAFAAPRQQSLDRQRAHQATLIEVQYALDASPRKYKPVPPPPPMRGFALKKIGSNMSFSKLRLGDSAPDTTPEPTTPLCRMAFRTPEQRRNNKENEANCDSQQGRSQNARNEACAPPGHSSLRDRLRRIGSLDSFCPHIGVPGTSTPRPSANRFAISRPSQDTRPADLSLSRKPSYPIPVPNHLAPHTLSLSHATPYEEIARPAFSIPSNPNRGKLAASSLSSSSRERLDRSRFEFKAVRKKGSQRHGSAGRNGLVDRGIGWVGHRVRGKENEETVEREGWI